MLRITPFLSHRTLGVTTSRVTSRSPTLPFSHWKLYVHATSLTRIDTNIKIHRVTPPLPTFWTARTLVPSTSTISYSTQASTTSPCVPIFLKPPSLPPCRKSPPAKTESFPSASAARTLPAMARDCPTFPMLSPLARLLRISTLANR